MAEAQTEHRVDATVIHMPAHLMDREQCSIPDHGDAFSLKGAKEIKRRIEEFWRKRGYAVSVHLHQAEFQPAIRSGRYDVRTNLVNGLPPGWKGSRK